MRASRRTIIAEEPHRTSIWTAIVLLVSLVCVFGLLTLLLVHDHEWADRFAALLPSPVGASSLAADPSLLGQIRTESPSAHRARLSDQSTALVLEATVVNDSLLPVANLIVEARVLAGGREKAAARSHCGKVVSDTLFNRLPRSELDVLLAIPVPASTVLEPGESLPCQIAFPDLGSDADEVEIRVASVEPLPGHPRPRRDPSE